MKTSYILIYIYIYNSVYTYMVIRFESTMSSQSLLYYGFLKYYLWLYGFIKKVI